jgi:hypothetical protein
MALGQPRAGHDWSAASSQRLIKVAEGMGFKGEFRHWEHLLGVGA